MNTRCSALAAMSLVGGGCATPLMTATIRMSPDRPLDDTSALAPDLVARHYHKLIVVAPPLQPKADGSELEALVRDAMDFAKKKEVPPPPPSHPAPVVAAADVERGLLRAGVTLIGSEVAGRASASDKESSRSERLLVLGKATGADAILEVVDLVWEPEARGRWFLYDLASNDFSETDAPTYDAKSRARRWSFVGPEVRVSARLIDAQSGSVEAEFHMACNALWNLPAPYAEEILVFARGLERGTSSYGLASALKSGRETCLTRIAERMAQAIGRP